VSVWLRRVTLVPEPTPGLAIAVDQSFHLVCLLGAALVAPGRPVIERTGLGGGSAAVGVLMDERPWVMM
jgi:hypothetical protein